MDFHQPRRVSQTLHLINSSTCRIELINQSNAQAPSLASLASLASLPSTRSSGSSTETGQQRRESVGTRSRNKWDRLLHDFFFFFCCPPLPLGLSCCKVVISHSSKRAPSKKPSWIFPFQLSVAQFLPTNPLSSLVHNGQNSSNQLSFLPEQTKQVGPKTPTHSNHYLRTVRLLIVKSQRVSGNTILPFPFSLN